MLDKKQIIVLVALNVVFIVIPLVFPCVHFTLDNDLMQFFSSGVYTGKPSEYTIYTNILHGLLLKMLYTFDSHVAWYAVYEYFYADCLHVRKKFICFHIRKTDCRIQSHWCQSNKSA